VEKHLAEIGVVVKKGFKHGLEDNMLDAVCAVCQ
jgi:hypothetical protein